MLYIYIYSYIEEGRGRRKVDGGFLDASDHDDDIIRLKKEGYMLHGGRVLTVCGLWLLLGFNF